MRLRLSHRSLLSLGITIASFPKDKKRFPWHWRDYKLIRVSDIDSLFALNPRMIVAKGMPRRIRAFYDDDFRAVLLSSVKGQQFYSLTIPDDFVISDISKRGYRHLKGVYFVTLKRRTE